MITRLLPSLVLVAAIPVSLAQVPDKHRHDLAERLGGHLLATLDTQPKLCPKNMYSEAWLSVMYCGNAAHLKSDDHEVILARVDEILSAYAPPEDEWTTEGARHRRSYRLEDVFFVVRLNTKRGVVSFSYPVQNFGCIDDKTIPLADGPRVSNPVLVEKVDPRYPEIARKGRVSGKVVVEAVIGKDGSVMDLCLMSSSPELFGFDAAAIEAVRQWRYEPAMRDGEPVAVRFHVIVDFSIH